MRVPLSLLVFIAGAVSGSAHAGLPRERLESFAKGLNALQGEFEQRVHDANGVLTETSTGTLALRAPRQFRWQYREPFPQLIVADGDNVWVYDEDLEQVTVKNQSAEESQSPLTVLTDLGQLDRDYRVSELPARDGLEWLKLEPKAEEATFVSCEIGFDAQGMARMVLTDTLGQRNELRFARWQRNPPLDEALFRFTPPEGVDVVGETVENADVFPVKG